MVLTETLFEANPAKEDRIAAIVRKAREELQWVEEHKAEKERQVAEEDERQHKRGRQIAEQTGRLIQTRRRGRIINKEDIGELWLRREDEGGH